MNKGHNTYNGILLFDKPAGITSHDVVLQIRRIIGQRKVGHTGTLDQRATGLMIICLGKATKISRFITDLEKVYEAEIYLGRKSKTYDGEGVFVDQLPIKIPDLTEREFKDILSEFTGIIKQKVPVYSAVRVQGQHLYKYARQGIDVEPPERDVEIKQIEFLDYKKPFLTIKVSCSKGTYVRALANDLGNRLGCGGYLSHLRRLSIGNLTLKKALTFDHIRTYHQNDVLTKKLIPYHKILDFGALTVTESFEKYVLSGKEVKRKYIIEWEGNFQPGDKIFLKNSQGEVLAVGQAEVSAEEIDNNNNKLFSYLRVLN